MARTFHCCTWRSHACWIVPLHARWMVPLLACWIVPLLALTLSGLAFAATEDDRHSDFGQTVLQEIRTLSEQLEKSRHIDATTSGREAALYSALGLIATGVTNALLHRTLHLGSPTAGLTDNINQSYLRTVLDALCIWLIPAGFSGLGIGMMSEGDASTPAITTAELKYPLAISLTTSALTSLAYTMLNSRFSSFGVGWYHLLNHAPTTVALMNSAIAMAGLTVWITRQRLDKEEQYQQLQLRLRNLNRQLQIIKSQNGPAL